MTYVSVIQYLTIWNQCSVKWNSPNIFIEIKYICSTVSNSFAEILLCVNAFFSAHLLTSSTKFSVIRYNIDSFETKFTTYNSAFGFVPFIVADRTPLIFMVDLNVALAFMGSDSSSYGEAQLAFFCCIGTPEKSTVKAARNSHRWNYLHYSPSEWHPFDDQSRQR